MGGRELVSGPFYQLETKLVTEIVTLLEQKPKGEPFHLFLSGGTTPRSLYQKLALRIKRGIYWRRLHIWQVDERCVPDDSPMSNSNVLRDITSALLEWPQTGEAQLKFMKSNFHMVDGENCYLGEAASLYEKEMYYHMGITGMDYVILGLGSDGHTAGIFSTDETAGQMVRVKKRKKDGLKGISLTLQALSKATRIRVLVIGAHKRSILQTLQQEAEGTEKYPITKLLDLAAKESVSFYVDDRAMPVIPRDSNGHEEL